VRSKRLVGLLAGVLCLALAGVALANTGAQSVINITAKPGSKNGGTKKKPQAQPKLTISIKGSTKDGTGQPQSSKAITTTLPSTWKINSAKWPKSKRCNIAKVNAAKSDKSCKGLSVGSGTSQAKAGNGGITQNLKLTAYVTNTGGIGFFLSGDRPTVVRLMLDGKVKNNVLTNNIPPSVQKTAGLPVGITDLTVNLNGKVKVKGKTIPLAQSTGCKGGKFLFKVTSAYVDGVKGSDTDTVACKK
jgi:hypothetical protein